MLAREFPTRQRALWPATLNSQNLALTCWSQETIIHHVGLGLE